MESSAPHSLSKIFRQPTEDENQTIQRKAGAIKVEAQKAIQAQLMKRNQVVSSLLDQVTTADKHYCDNVREIVNEMTQKLTQLRILATKGLPNNNEQLAKAVIGLQLEELCQSTLEVAAGTPTHTESIGKEKPTTARQLDQDHGNIKLTESQRVVELAKISGNQTELATALLNLGMFCHLQDQYAQGVEALQECMELARSLEMTSLECDSLFTLGNLHFENGLYDAAIQAYAASAELCHKLEDSTKQMNVVFNLANAYLRNTQFDEAAHCFSESLAIARSLGSASETVRNLECLAAVYLQKDLPHESINCFQEAISLCTDTEKSAVLHHQLGGVYHNNCCYELAIEAYQKGISLFRESNNLSGLGQSLCHIGGTYLALDQNNDATSALLECVEIGTKIGNPPWLKQAYTRLSKAYFTQDMVEQAMQVATQAAFLESSP